ncbi:hypothetical protein L7F22_020572 [Adiantum nelumboides]|nr:hypothetical protein [Adiantum nelumboides]
MEPSDVNMQREELPGFNARVVTLETITQSTTARVSEGEIHLQQLQTQIATSGRSQGGPTATIPYKTTNFSGEEKECTELAVNNWIHQWTTYFDLHEESDERRILTIPLYLHNKALTWWRDMTEKPTTWADFCTKFKKDFAKMDPLKAYDELQSLSMKTLSFDKYTTAFKEALTFCKVDATHAVHMYLLGLHEDYRWALIKDKAPTDVEDAVAKARTFHLINGANYEKKRAYDHNLSEGCTPKKKPRFQPKASKIQSRPSFDTTPRDAKEKKKAKNAMIADAVKKGACFGCGQMGHQIKDCPNKKLKKPQGRPSVHLHEISGGVKGPKNSGPRRKANPPIIWNEHLDESFNKLKHLVTTAPMLHIVDPSKPFVVETDASDYALGAALYQDGRPVAFESKKLSDAEMRYPTYEKELYAVIHALKKWRHYLYGSKFIAWTDHHSLRYICDQDDLRGRKARWVELMQEFDFEIRYRKGSTNKVADALSRNPEVNALSMAEISTDFYLAFRGLYRSDRHFGKVWNEVEIGCDSRIGLGDPETQVNFGL